MSAAASTGGMGTTGQQPQLQLKNRLAESRSPYVRGHKDNPTAWQMWNEETLALAKRSQRLIFLSVGYSSCHCTSSLLSRALDGQEVGCIWVHSQG